MLPKIIKPSVTRNQTMCSFTIFDFKKKNSSFFKGTVGIGGSDKTRTCDLYDVNVAL